MVLVQHQDADSARFDSGLFPAEGLVDEFDQGMSAFTQTDFCLHGTR